MGIALRIQIGLVTVCTIQTGLFGNPQGIVGYSGTFCLRSLEVLATDLNDALVLPTLENKI